MSRDDPKETRRFVLTNMKNIKSYKFIKNESINLKQAFEGLAGAIK